MLRKLSLLMAALVASAASLQAQALETRKFCIWDPVGANGPAVTFFSDIPAKAVSWGIKAEITAYTDERVASNDFKAGECDVVFLTAILGRQFGSFGGSLDALGGIVDQKGLGIILKALTNPKLGGLLSQGKYETIGSLPVGSVYFFVNDRGINSFEKMSGKKISVLNEDPQSLAVANKAGASPVGTTLATFSGQFNNGNIDIVPMVALGYNVFELYHGLGDKGGIIDEKVTYGMMQLISQKERFSDDFGVNMRTYILSRLKDINKLVDDAEAEIPQKYWIKSDAATKDAIAKFQREIRLDLRDKGLLDPKALKMMWKIRCSVDPSKGECATPE